MSQLLEKTKLAGERHLLERKEKLILELQKLKLRVDEFNDYGEMDMMQQYVNDVRTMQRRIQAVHDEIEVRAHCAVFAVGLQLQTSSANITWKVLANCTREFWQERQQFPSNVAISHRLNFEQLFPTVGEQRGATVQVPDQHLP